MHFERTCFSVMAKMTLESILSLQEKKKRDSFKVSQRKSGERDRRNYNSVTGESKKDPLQTTQCSVHPPRALKSLWPKQSGVDIYRYIYSEKGTHSRASKGQGKKPTGEKRKTTALTLSLLKKKRTKSTKYIFSSKNASCEIFCAKYI